MSGRWTGNDRGDGARLAQLRRIGGVTCNKVLAGIQSFCWFFPLQALIQGIDAIAKW
jgi:hypothetical protein